MVFVQVDSIFLDSISYDLDSLDSISYVSYTRENAPKPSITGEETRDTDHYHIIRPIAQVKQKRISPGRMIVAYDMIYIYSIAGRASIVFINSATLPIVGRRLHNIKYSY